jgi:hypothetical protein
MKRIATVILSTSLTLLCACSRKPPAREGRAMLIGDYLLHIGSTCRQFGIEYAKITLLSNGTYSQEGKFKNGVSYNIGAKKWEYDSDGNVFLYELRTSRTLDISPEAQLTNANLIVEFGRPTLILLNPDGDCFFQKTE